MSEETVMINKVRDYMAQCPYLGEYVELNIDYLIDKVKAFSINENAGYNPILNQFLSRFRKTILIYLRQ